METAEARNAPLQGKIEIDENYSYIRESLKQLVITNREIGRNDVYKAMRELGYDEEEIDQIKSLIKEQSKEK